MGLFADMNTDGKVMGWIFDEYSKFAGFSPGRVRIQHERLPSNKSNSLPRRDCVAKFLMLAKS